MNRKHALVASLGLAAFAVVAATVHPFLRITTGAAPHSPRAAETTGTGANADDLLATAEGTSGGGHAAVEATSPPPAPPPITIIPFVEAVVEPSGQQLRLRWHLEDIAPGPETWKYWARPDDFFPAGQFTFDTDSSNRNQGAFTFENEGTQLPDAASVRVLFDNGDLTIDAYIDIKGPGFTMWPAEGADMGAAGVSQGFICAFDDDNEQLPFETQAINPQWDVDTTRIGVVPYTNIFDTNLTPQAALWCEAGAQQVHDFPGTPPGGPVRLTTYLDRSGWDPPRNLSAIDDHRPWFVADDDTGARFGKENRAEVDFNLEGTAHVMTVPHHAHFDLVKSEMLLAVCLNPVPGTPSDEGDAPLLANMHAVTKHNTAGGGVSWFLGHGAGGYIFGIHGGATQLPMNAYTRSSHATMDVVIIRVTTEGDDAPPLHYSKIEAWLNGQYRVLGEDVITPVWNGPGPLVVGAKDVLGQVLPFQGQINEIFFAPGPSTYASVSALMYEMHRRWGLRIEDNHVVANIGNPAQPTRKPLRRPIAEINLFGGHYTRGDYQTGQHEKWFDHGQAKEEITDWLNDEQFAAIKAAEQDGQPGQRMDVMLRLPGGRLAGDNMNCDGLGWITQKQKEALQDFINEAVENNGDPSFIGTDPPRRLWVYTGAGMPFDYSTNDYGFNIDPNNRRDMTKSVMQNRVMPPAIAAHWRTLVVNRYLEIHPKLLNYIGDAAATQFERYIGVAHDGVFNASHLLMLEPLIIDPEPGNHLLKFVPLYSSMHYKHGRWWASLNPGIPPTRTWQCSLIPQSDEFFYYYASGGGAKVNTISSTNSPCPSTPTTPEASRYWLNEQDVRNMRTRGQPAFPNTGYIPIGKAGEDPQQIMFYEHCFRGWFID